MYDETVNFVVAKLLPQTWKREATKQSLDMIHDAKFDRQYEAMLKEKNIQSEQQLVPLTKEKLMPKKLFDYVTPKIQLPPEPEYFHQRHHQKDFEMMQHQARISTEPKPIH